MLYVLSGIHGNKDHFDNILEKINLRMEDSLYILSDVIDRYPHDIQLLQQIMGSLISDVLLPLINDDVFWLHKVDFVWL